MAYAQGYNAKLLMAVESTYGTASSSTSYLDMPVMSVDPGLAADPVEIENLGTGRNGGSMLPGLVTVQPRIEVPVDTKSIGWWLALALGQPTTAESTGVYTHVFNSGGTSIPSATLQINNPDTTEYIRLLGCKVNTLSFNINPDQVVQSLSIGLIGQSYVDASSSIDTTPVSPSFSPISGANGSLSVGGTLTGSATGLTMEFSNVLETYRTLSRRSTIAEPQPGVVTLSGTLNARMDDDTLSNAARAQTTALNIAAGYYVGADERIELQANAAYLSLNAPPISGRAGVQASFNFTGAKTGSYGKLRVVLVNDQANYTWV